MFSVIWCDIQKFEQIKLLHLRECGVCMCPYICIPSVELKNAQAWHQGPCSLRSDLSRNSAVRSIMCKFLEVGKQWPRSSPPPEPHTIAQTARSRTNARCCPWSANNDGHSTRKPDKRKKNTAAAAAQSFSRT